LSQQQKEKESFIMNGSTSNPTLDEWNDFIQELTRREALEKARSEARERARTQANENIESVNDHWLPMIVPME